MHRSMFAQHVARLPVYVLRAESWDIERDLVLRLECLFCSGRLLPSAYTEGMATLNVNGATVRFEKFSSLALAKSFAGRKEWIVMGEPGEYLIVRPVDAAKLMAAGYELVNKYA